MDELFTSRQFSGGFLGLDNVPTSTKNAIVMASLIVIAVALLLTYYVVIPMHLMHAKKEGFAYLGASTNVIRDDTGFPNTNSLDELYRSKQEKLVEAGRYPNIGNSQPLDLANQLDMQNAVAKAAMSAPKSSFTERMSPEDKLRREQAHQAGH